jgi:peptide/nickel transport system substrate-binding protein
MALQSRHWSRAFPLILLTFLVGLVLIACGSSDDEPTSTAEPDSGDSTAAATADTSGSGGVLRIGMTAGNLPFPNTPPNEGFEGRRFVGYQIYDGLFRWTVEQGDTVPEPVPALAESYELSDDQLTWTFKLREDVLFHDGTTFDAEDVMFQFNRLTDESFEWYDSSLAASNSSSFAQIESYEMIDQYTVAITTSQPYSFLPYDLAYVYFPSPEVVMEYGNDDYIKHATGTGPFAMTEYIDGQVMELTAFDEYWGGRPKLDKVILYPMPEPATRLAALQAGDIDWAELPPPDAVELLEAQDFQVLLKEYPHVITYQLNTYSGPLSDVRVRQALNYAVDREGTATLINNVGFPATQYMYPGHPWFDEDWEGYTYDPDKAKALLEEAGYGDGVSLRLIYPTGGSGNMFPGPMNEKLKQDLAAVGIELELIPIEWNNIITALRQGFNHPDWEDYDMSYISLAPIAPTGWRLYVSDYIPPASCCNQTGYANPDADALYYEAASTFDKAEQDELLKHFQSTMMKDAPVLVTVHDLNLRALAPYVKGFVQPQSWFISLNDVWLDN